LSGGVDKPYVGGQAVIEGVMMRSPRCLAIAVRRQDGTIVVREDAWISIWERLKFLRWPFFRGAVVLAESVYNGIQALNFAAAQAEVGAPAEGADDPTAQAQAKVQQATGQAPTPAPVVVEPEKAQGSALTIAVSFLMAIGLFVGLPHALAWLTGAAAGQPLDVDSFLFHLLDGLFKLAIFVAYIWGISLIPEIRRVFEYHGAEHKVVNVYENDMELSLENARRFTTFHARCGTSFLLFVLVLSIFMFAAVFPFIPKVSDVTVVNHLAMIFIKVPLMLPLAGFAYEINRFASRHPEQLWVQAIVAPGRLMQKLTTKEPSDDQLEIALAAMRAALAREAALVGVDAEAARAAAQQSAGTVAVFQDYGHFAASVSGH
jgi:uncharacterized protein YqhQ